MAARTEERLDRLEQVVEQNAEAIRVTDAAVRKCTENIEALANRTMEWCDRLDRTVDRLARLVEDVLRLSHDHEERLNRLGSR